MHSPPRFVLVAHTRGDELLPSQTVLVANSLYRETLEDLRDCRAEFRTTWLAANDVPASQLGTVIAFETIENVMTA